MPRNVNTICAVCEVDDCARWLGTKEDGWRLQERPPAVSLLAAYEAESAKSRGRPYFIFVFSMPRAGIGVSVSLTAENVARVQP